MNGAVFALTPTGRQLALKLGATLGFTVYLPQKLWQESDPAVAFTKLQEQLQRSFRERKQLVLIMACGIAVRLLAPLLTSKQHDPAVVVMDEGGHFAVSLLSGHWGGANDLARQLATLSGAVPVITTATDVAGLYAIDEFARKVNALPEPFSRIKEFNAAQLRGETIAVFGQSLPPASKDGQGLRFFPLEQLALTCADYSHRAILTPVDQQPGARPNDLYLRPPNLFVGVGCRRGMTAERIIAAIKEVFGRFNLACASLVGLASIEQKSDEAGLLAAASMLGVAIQFFSKEAITEQIVPCEQSQFVKQTMGVGAVCEPTALLAARSRILLVPKQKMNGITVAVALAAYPWSESAPEPRNC